MLSALCGVCVVRVASVTTEHKMNPALDVDDSCCPERAAFAMASTLSAVRSSAALGTNESVDVALSPSESTKRAVFCIAPS